MARAFNGIRHEKFILRRYRPATLLVHVTWVVLRRQKPLLRRLGVPVERHDVVLGDALAAGVHQTKVVLCARIPLFSKRLPQQESFLVRPKKERGSYLRGKSSIREYYLHRPKG